MTLFGYALLYIVVGILLIRGGNYIAGKQGKDKQLSLHQSGLGVLLWPIILLVFVFLLIGGAAGGNIDDG